MAVGTNNPSQAKAAIKLKADVLISGSQTNNVKLMKVTLIKCISISEQTVSELSHNE